MSITKGTSGAVVVAMTALGCIATFVALLEFGHVLPRVSFYTLPSLYYAVAVTAALTLRGRTIGNAGRIALALGFSTLFVLVGQALILSQGVPTRWLAWGRFPLGDSADFLANAVILVQEGEFVSIRGRPLANAFIAGLWRVTGFDLALLGLATSGLCAIALFFYARVALACFGVAGGAISVVIAGDFLHEHLGAASTEPIGFFTGAAACTLLIAAAVNRSGTLFAFGVFALTFAFMIRAGALFIIPCLLLLPLVIQLTTERRRRWITGALVGIAAAIGFHTLAANSFTPDSPSFVNAPKSWYAIIAMGDEALGRRPAGSVREEARWVQIFDDHPGLRELPIDSQGEHFIEIVTKAATERPLSALAGMALEYQDQLLRAGLFRFIDNKPIRALAFALFLVGLSVAAIRAHRDPVGALFALSGLGVLLSIPFLHGGENRVHIATAGLMAGTVGYAIAAGGAVYRRERFQGSIIDTRPIRRWVYGALCLPSFAILICAYTAVSGSIEVSAKSEDHTTCANGTAGLLTATGTGSALAVGAMKPGGFAVHFKNQDALMTARQAWFDQAAWNALLHYAPITPAALPAPDSGESGHFWGLLYTANLERTNAVPLAGAGLWALLDAQDFGSGVRRRCLRDR